MLRFSTDQYPERERVPIWREVFGRQVFRVDLEVPSDAQFIGDITVHSAPGLGVLSGIVGRGVRSARTRELIGDGVNDLLLMVNRTGRASMSQRGQDHALDPCEAALCSLGEVGGIVRQTMGSSFSLRIPHAALSSLIPRLDDAVMRPIPRDRDALKLLIGYVDVLQETNALSIPEVVAAAVRHVHDLAALTIAPTPNALDVARGRGVRAALVATIKADIAANVGRPNLSVEMIAQRHGISTRYIHRLFEHDDLSFAQFVLEQRLARAHRMLTEPRFREWTIATIAEKSGFSDRSHFNRKVRQRYGASPSDLRTLARRGDGK
jgi:AraC-like DNA-binding protein